MNKNATQTEGSVNKFVGYLEAHGNVLSRITKLDTEIKEKQMLYDMFKNNRHVAEQIENIIFDLQIQLNFNIHLAKYNEPSYKKLKEWYVARIEYLKNKIETNDYSLELLCELTYAFKIIKELDTILSFI